MRTTVSIDEDVLLAARQRADSENTSLGRALSDLARLGLSHSSTGTHRNGIKLLPAAPGAGRATLESVNAIRDDLE